LTEELDEICCFGILSIMTLLTFSPTRDKILSPIIAVPVSPQRADLFARLDSVGLPLDAEQLRAALQTPVQQREGDKGLCWNSQ